MPKKFRTSSAVVRPRGLRLPVTGTHGRTTHPKRRKVHLECWAAIGPSHRNPGLFGGSGGRSHFGANADRPFRFSFQSTTSRRHKHMFFVRTVCSGTGSQKVEPLRPPPRQPNWGMEHVGFYCPLLSDGRSAGTIATAAIILFMNMPSCRERSQLRRSSLYVVLYDSTYSRHRLGFCLARRRG